MRCFRSVAALFLVSVLCLAAFAGFSPRPAAAQLPSADLTVLRVTGPHQSTVNRVVTIKILAANQGPATSQLDVGVTFSAGLELAEMRCDLGISPDTPACEYANVAPGTRLTTLVSVHILEGSSSSETITSCTGNEGQTEDPNPNNDCILFTIRIAGQ
jgi:Domain of unknown function DUF11